MSENNDRIPLPHHPFNHSIDLQIRFNDIDIFGHINNAVYFQYFDFGKLTYFENVLGRDFAQNGFTAVIVNINCDFFAPSYLNEPLAVLTQVTRIGEKSINLGQRIINTQTGDVKSICTTIMAGIDLKTSKSAPIPEIFRKTLADFEKIDMPE